MELLKRTYKSKDVDMLSISAAIILQAIKHQVFLAGKRPKWADPFFKDLAEHIDAAFSNILGIDNAKEMRTATQALLTIQAKALRDLSEFKVQLEADFKDNKNRLLELLTNLGFSQHYKQVHQKDQQAMVDLLFQFKLNMSPELQTEITNAGTRGTLITAITGYADELKNSNVTQETLKGSRKEVSQAGITELNGIYSEVINIAKIAANFFKDNKAVQSQFVYSKVAKGL
ncbi:MAG: hypothetical protein WBP45_15920 [Daejeonella sp.]